ncbi:MAG: T9SS type A sorting domain-containing protein [Saprospiraceae bacterium]|nr:T9SS type A sorting domain-containing protein [Saprospiraceae bacterium]
MRQTNISTKILIRLCIGLLICFQTGSISAQAGCTDQQATNFDPLATLNDGSCTYPPTTYTLDLVADLSETLVETSGLAFLDGSLWTHNDGGNPDVIYRIDTLNGDILQSVIIATAFNQDWEDMAQDDQYLYVGDFGNNSGDRQDLVIYRILRSDLGSNVVNADVIQFSYEDQTTFNSLPYQTNFDCEAFFVKDDSLHLFTKHWVDYKTKHYVLPAEPGTQVAALRDSLDVQLLITGADMGENGEVILLGWNPVTGNSAFWLLFDYPNQNIFKGNKRRINLGYASLNSQPEGISFSSAYEGFISSENFLSYPQRLLRFSIESWVSNIVSTHSTPPSLHLQIAPNPSENTLCLQGLEQHSDIQISVLDTQGKLVYGPTKIKGACVNTGLQSGLYFVRFREGNANQTLKWICK